MHLLDRINQYDPNVYTSQSQALQVALNLLRESSRAISELNTENTKLKQKCVHLVDMEV